MSTTALTLLKEKLGANLIAVYQVGIQNAPQFDDFDVVCIVSDPKAAKDALSGGIKDVDIRGVFTAQEAKEEFRFLPYQNFELCFGTAVEYVRATSDENLIKLAGMFYYAFLRNFYRLYYRRKVDCTRTLIALNDFEYALLWGNAQIRDVCQPFVEKIRQSRRDHIDKKDDCRTLLADGINMAWKVIALLDVVLSNKPECDHNRLCTPKENTKFLEQDAAMCREKTENLRYVSAYVKKLFLPKSFKTLLCQPEGSFEAGYAQRNLLYRKKDAITHLKHVIKNLA